MSEAGEERTLFDIPIYLCDEGKHWAYMEKMKSDYLRPLANLRQRAPHSYRVAECRFEENVRYIWRYNEVIGWISLSLSGSEIKGELYFVRSKRVSRGIRKQFHWTGGIFAIDIFPEDTSPAIFKKICTELEGFRGEPKYRKWYLDLEAFRNMGPFVKWREMVRSN